MKNERPTLTEAEIEQIKEALKRTYKERFELATRLYKIQQTVNKAVITHKSDSDVSNFDTLWNNHVKTLQGKNILTAIGKLNTVITVTNEFLDRISSRGNKSKVKRVYIEAVYYELLSKKLITRAQIDKSYGKRCSSIVTVILAKFQNVTLETSPVIHLKLTN